MPAQIEPGSPFVVAGGAGFLGSHLCERLLSEGHPVLCLDNFVTGTRANVEHLSDKRPFTVRRWDIAEPIALFGAQGVFNLACPASPCHYQADPIRTTMTSVKGAYNLLELARAMEVSLLQASTSEVYGDPTMHPQKESYWGHVNPTGIRACYDEGKRCAESLCFDYQRMYGVNVKVARIFNTYGPRMQLNDGRVVSNFIVQALRGEPLTVYGNGSQTRSFCYVDDLIDGFMRLMLHPQELRSPVNLGNPQEFTILELAELVLALTGSRASIVLRPLPSDDPVQRCPDIDRAEAELGWKPRVQLPEGLERTIAYFDWVLSGDARPRKRRPVKPVAAVTPAPLAVAPLPVAPIEETVRRVNNVQR
jgi:UDP-glucuronate decarboxylase